MLIGRVFLWLSLVCVGLDVRAETTGRTRLAREARAILSNKCFACHGPDRDRRQADLRLDTATGVQRVIRRDSDSGGALLDRIHSDDPNRQMPPPKMGKPLTSAELQTLTAWVDSGGEFTGHWAFDVPIRPAVPSGRNAVNHFIDAEIRRQGLIANPPASMAAQFRRAALLLTGLPPTRHSIDRLARGEIDYETYVDELLASPAFGQHFGRYWLDLVRYGDTHGRNLDNYREMWPYRDWVIRAFNDNLPFDRFLIEQLAGDLFPNATTDQRIASGFNRLNLTTTEVGSIYAESFARNVSDRTDAFGTVFLGLTTQCAACHDHKYDPLTQREYYSLSAYFNSLDGSAVDENSKAPAPFIRLPTEAQRRGVAEIDTEIARLREELAGPIEAVDDAQRQWELGPWTQGRTDRRHSIAVGETTQCGPFPAESIYAAFDRRYASELRDFVPDESFEHDGVVFEWQSLPKWAPLERFDLPTEGFGTDVNLVHQTLLAKKSQRATLLVQTSADYQVYLNHTIIADSRRSGKSDSHAKRYVLQLSRGTNDLYIKTMSSSPCELACAVRSPNVAPPESIAGIARKPEADRSDDERHQLRSYFREIVCDHVDWTFPSDLLAGAETRKQKLEDSFTTSLIWKERDPPRVARVLSRGRYDSPGEVVQRGVPSFLPPPAVGASEDRAGLARWLTAPNHPLTARVAVNRFWQALFGTGLVETSEDFGHQGQLPSHPELLDWLALDFVENGWDVKRLIKQMATSRAFRRSARVRERDRLMDPANRYLARGPRFRLDAEVLRDQALALGGLLDAMDSGPSVKPPQPDGLWKAVGYIGSNTARFRAESVPGREFARSVYIFWKRTSSPPQMSTLDAPSREACTARRERTNTPMQALLLMNETQYLRAAKALAARALTECQSREAIDRLRWLFQTVTARQPDDEETRELMDLFGDLLQHYVANKAAAAELLSIDEEQLNGGDDRVQAAWMVVASALLNLDEIVNP